MAVSAAAHVPVIDISDLISNAECMNEVAGKIGWFSCGFDPQSTTFSVSWWNMIQPWLSQALHVASMDSSTFPITVCPLIWFLVWRVWVTCFSLCRLRRKSSGEWSSVAKPGVAFSRYDFDPPKLLQVGVFDSLNSLESKVSNLFWKKMVDGFTAVNLCNSLCLLLSSAGRRTDLGSTGLERRHLFWHRAACRSRFGCQADASARLQLVSIATGRSEIHCVGVYRSCHFAGPLRPARHCALAWFGAVLFCGPIHGGTADSVPHL